MNIVYNASAGTGKTYQVTGLYEKLVLDEAIDPRKILLMTFTDNAAAELRMRVAHRLLRARREAEESGNDATAERAIAAMTHLPSAPIGTIHSFCTRLLREHALEAGLSPGFSVLVGDEHKELLNQICREELLKQLETDPDFKTFCAGAQMIGTGGGFGSSVTETVPALIGQAGSLGISLEHAEAMLPEPRPPVSIVDFLQILKELKGLAKQTKKTTEAIVALEKALEQTDDPLRLVELFGQNFSGHFSYGEAKSIYPRFKQLREETVEREHYRTRFPAAKAFARYVQTVATRFQQRKHAMDSVDFDDQLRMAAELLASGKAKPEFDYVIVDEVQDTSRIQCDLIQALWNEHTRLIICGDKKQSIYTWRGADPEVMPDLQQLIVAAGGELENLNTSYRSKAPILDVVNALFSSVYGAEDYAEGDRLEANPDFETDGEKACVEFLESDIDEDLSKQDQVAAEMKAVANRIQLLVHGDSDWQPAYRHADGFQPTGGGNAYRYSDILILLRRTTHQSALEQALRHQGIPYTLGGKGRGLFTRQETRDVSLFLNVVTNPKDAYSLVGFLRSPWIGLSDETIAELAWSNEGFSIGTLMANAANQTDVIDRYRELPGTKLASELVRLLIDETGYDALLAGLPRGAQRLANLRKVLDWLRDAERGARTTPAAVARKLAQQIANPPQVPEAALLDPAQNAVTLMTVHGSKGLTKRVVFLPDTSFRPDSDRGFARISFDDEHQPMLGVKVTSPDKSQAASPGFAAANERAKAVRAHELKNLFYVAMTRARDLVVTSSTKGKISGGWLKDMEPFIGKEIPAIPYARLADAVEIAEAEPAALPTEGGLARALDSLPPPPPQPTLRRIPATRLAKEQDELESDGPFDPTGFRSVENAAAIGSLGHAVLEQLALNGWEGSVAEWLEILREDFGATKAEAGAMEERIGQTRELMIQLTGSMKELLPEFPFVLHEDDTLIDGTIDLLCQTSDGFAIFDYKFTEASDEKAVADYQGQMEIYRKAAEKKYPHAGTADIRLIVASSAGVRTVKCM
ncbi:ATP-dependent helicase/nuclease subunit A [Pontiella desulfatans]|uniref:DNA 3'-5' helicase n=1 Tax=Pontiella desulfatans TaxID=2750659 RepID=A0A6C2U8W4_PONDE|nr:UvrD-helicase domain-containing protein [Pontiella desulfatans]VGO16500.1 ATP-dependent helicase/nuclease subunit A [Pontiella desulfatans]